MKFLNKTVLVTGGSSGMGDAIVRRFISEGAKVIVFDLSRSDQEVTFFKVDISNPSEVENAFKQITQLDILINNAGIYSQALIEEMANADIAKMIDINLKGPIWVTKYALHLIKKSNGNIVNISSCLGLITEPGSSIYCATKAGVIMLTKNWSQEYANLGIRVNAVLPGPIDTPLLRKFLPTDEDVKNHGLKKPFKRIGLPQEVANVVAFVASDEASYVTGGVYSVDGGESASSLYSK